VATHGGAALMRVGARCRFMGCTSSSHLHHSSSAASAAAGACRRPQTPRHPGAAVSRDTRLHDDHRQGKYNGRV